MSKTAKPFYKPPRVAAAEVVANVLRGKSLSSLLPIYSDQVAEKENALLKELCFGCLRWYPQIAPLLKKLIEKPLREKDLEVQGLVAIGIYQLLYMRISAHAVVNETVEATKGVNRPWAKGLVNAVLRRFQRERITLLEELSDDKTFQSAHPKWLLNKLTESWPANIVKGIISSNNSQGPMTLRVNTLKNSRDAYLEILRKEGIAGAPTKHSSVGVILNSAVSVASLPGFDSGSCSVQDEAAQLAADLLSLKPGHIVLDACCAPGGKTCHILEAEPNLKSLLAIDSEPRRLNKVTANLTRLNLDAALCAADATNLKSWWDGCRFDRILLDAPCSATGVIRRHPDIKLLRKPADIDTLATIQLTLLQRLWQTLANGGILVYATCSILPSENDEVVKTFIKQQQDAEIMTISDSWGEASEYGRQLFPMINGHDGFYYSRLRKIGGPD